MTTCVVNIWNVAGRLNKHERGTINGQPAVDAASCFRLHVDLNVYFFLLSFNYSGTLL